uniref:C2H2-type domain-containing protein n=1 Tax=Timema cristinae TaxID=61476 RepID=A0A7R9CMU2_TIMCR|nr:unnamed protein product [Timema cristinae]
MEIEDIEEVVDAEIEELTNEELQELAQNLSSESDSEEDKPSRTFTMKSMATAFHRIQGLQMLANEDPDVERSARVHRTEWTGDTWQREKFGEIDRNGRGCARRPTEVETSNCGGDDDDDDDDDDDETTVHNTQCENRISTLSLLSVEKEFLDELPSQKSFYDAVIDKFIQKDGVTIAYRSEMLVRASGGGHVSDMTSEIREEIENNVSVPSDEPAALSFSPVSELEDVSEHIPVHFLLRSDDEMYGLHDIVPGSNLTGSTTHSTIKFKIKRRFKERVKVNKNRSNASEEEKTENIIEEQDDADLTVFSDKQTNTSFLQQVIKEIEHDRHKPISKNGKSDNLPKLTQSSSNKSTLVKQEIFKCNDCNKCFSRKQNFVEHYRVHSKLKPYICKECGKGFSTSSNLKRHVTIHRNGQIKYKCDKCGTLFNQADHLSEHLHKQYKCEECGKDFVTRSKLNRHGFRHTGQKPHKCDVCGKYFGDVGNLRQHLVIHSGIKPFKCEVCGGTALSTADNRPREFGLFYLVQSQHCTQGKDELEGRPPPSDDDASKEGNYSHMVMSGDASLANIMEPKIEILEKCEDCDKLFKTKENLTAHRLVHNKQYNCSKCGKSFLFKDSLADHACTRNKTERHKCEECGKCFSKSSNLNQHRLTHNGPNEFVLNQHRLFHCSEKPYRCEYCGKCFKSNSSICQHRLTHSENKKYMCEECGKRFKILAALNQHRLTHRGYRPHTCEECGKGFALRSQLSRHWLVHAKHKT